MRKLKIALLVVVAIIFLGYVVFQFAYWRVERLTRLHGAEFAPAVAKLSNEVQYYKVFEYGPTQAKVFIVKQSDPNHRLGSYIYFKRTLQGWEYVKGDLVWATLGSADGWTWPPYW